MLHLAVVLFIASAPRRSRCTFRLELLPSGSQVSIGEPVSKAECSSSTPTPTES